MLNFYTPLPQHQLMDFQKYWEFVANFVKMSKQALISFWFQIYNISGTNSICEHDVGQSNLS